MVGKTLSVCENPGDPRPARAHWAPLGLLRLVTSTSVFLGLNALLVAAFSSLLYGVEARPVVLAIAFLATFSVYNMNRATDRAEDSINRPETASRGNMFFLVPSLAASALCLMLCASVGAQALLVVLTSYAASILYSVRLSPSIPRGKEVVGLKSVLVALSWGLTGALLPAIGQSVDPAKMALVFTYITVQLFVNTVLCDVRDVEGDRASGVRTLPIALGLGGTRSLLLAVNSLTLPWLAICATRGLFLEYMPALLFGAVYGFAVTLAFSGGRRGRLLVELTVDGEWIPLVALMALL